MGYYSGNGIVTGGDWKIRTFGTLVYQGVHIVYQRTKSTITRKMGVSLETAQSETPSMSLGSYTWGWANIYPWAGCVGSMKDTSYQQIGDSNLYELVINNSIMQASDDGSTWISNGNA